MRRLAALAVLVASCATPVPDASPPPPTAPLGAWRVRLTLDTGEVVEWLVPGRCVQFHRVGRNGLQAHVALAPGVMPPQPWVLHGGVELIEVVRVGDLVAPQDAQ